MRISRFGFYDPGRDNVVDHIVAFPDTIFVSALKLNVLLLLLLLKFKLILNCSNSITSKFDQFKFVLGKKINRLKFIFILLSLVTFIVKHLLD